MSYFVRFGQIVGKVSAGTGSGAAGRAAGGAVFGAAGRVDHSRHSLCMLCHKAGQTQPVLAVLHGVPHLCTSDLHPLGNLSVKLDPPP